MKKASKTDDSKIIIVLGPTASGKSDLAVKLAKKFNGEVISADSRQVYKGLNIGSGKITKKEMMGIPHHLLDIANPKRKFSVAKYKSLAEKSLKDILKKQKTPIICGGTGFYIKSLVDGISIPEVKPDWKLRKQLEQKNEKELFEELKKLDKNRAKNIDQHNKRRIIRALEIIITTGKPVAKIKINPLPHPTLFIGIKKEKAELKKLIKKRLEKRMKQGMVAEVKNLHKKEGLSFKRLEEFGLEYKWLALFLQKKITKGEMTLNLQKDIESFTNRQMTYFALFDHPKKRINWIKNYSEAEKLTKDFIG